MMLKSGPEEDVPCFRGLEIWKASGCYQMAFGISMLFFGVFWCLMEQILKIKVIYS